MSGKQVSNSEIADKLEHVAGLLEQQGENPFRIKSYRRAADTLRQRAESVAQLCAEEGPEALEKISGVGEKLARAVQEIVETGRLRLEDRLAAEVTPEAMLAQVPGVGETLARELHEQLGIESLEALENAAHDGRLADFEGIGEKRLAGIRDALAGMLSPAAQRRARQRQADDQVRQESGEAARPSVATLLAVDEEYRSKAGRGELKKIAPRRFNPEGKAWLPILKTQRDGWSFTLLFSNTAKAHELHKTDDWVVVYFERDGEERQRTIITAERGELKGKRIIRGRESECRRHYGVG